MDKHYTYLQELFGTSVSQYGQNCAVRYKNLSITYTELDLLSTQMANYITTNYAQTPFIGVSTARSIHTITAILATLKAGKAYVPLDKDYPDNRLLQIIEEANLRCCIAPTEEVKRFESLSLSTISPEQAINYTKDLPPVRATQHGNAYVLFTSGSTGKPKGVLMGHRPLINLIEWQKKHSTANSTSITLQFSPLTFDVSFQEIFATLSTGGTLALIDDDVRLNSLDLLQFMEQQQVNRIFLPFVALQMMADTAVQNQLFPASLQEVITAGEQLKITPHLAAFFSAIPSATLSNQYGPTECHVVSELKLSGSPKDWPELPSIGKAIDNVSLWILDEQGFPLPTGETGELYIGGACLAEGYLQQEDLTKEKFITLELEEATQRLYKTGDLAKALPDGTFAFLGRKDLQVKIRGYRIELGEIEVQLIRLPQVKDAVVAAFGEQTTDKKLIAFLIAETAHHDTDAVKQALKKIIPDYMLPSAFVWIPEFPKTASGKVDRKALRLPLLQRPELMEAFTPPHSIFEKQMAQLWKDLLQMDRVGIHDHFFELGGNSLLAQKTVNHLLQNLQLRLPITKLYQYPTIAGIQDFLNKKNKLNLPMPSPRISQKYAGPIAVIGMDVRLPGADSLEDFLHMLEQGQEGISFFDDTSLDPSLPQELIHDTHYVPARGIIKGIEQFDASFFGISPALAELMDPQHRIFLELTYTLLEKTGYLKSPEDHLIGVFAGCGSNTYFLNNVLNHPDKIKNMGFFPVSYVTEKDYISTRTAYHLNLKGPAISVLSACSTSALAITQAVENLREGKCDLAIAGAASIQVPQYSGHLYEEGAMFSKDGHCRPFDAEATGTVFSDGAGVVLLKPLEQAIADQDCIYAVIKGIGISNDGRNKASFTAPSATGQSLAIRMAIEEARVDPLHVGFVEAHGTATPIGDPIEIEGLHQAFGETSTTPYCAIGSVKGNIGHLTHAAGVTGLIKAALSLHTHQLFPTLHYKKANPAINFASSPFFVNTTLQDWPESTKKIAGVSSFGVGGTNVHIILEAFETKQVEKELPQKPQEDEKSLLCWSAKTQESVLDYAQKLVTYLNQYPQTSLQDIAYSLSATKPDYLYKTAIVAHSRSALIALLSDLDGLSKYIQKQERAEDPVVFLFPGQGSQFINMGKELYSKELVFRQAVDQCALMLSELMDEDIRQIIYPELESAESAEKLKDTYYTQPALFVISYALSQLWISWGVRPNAFLGHSVGEFVAAHLAGVFSLEDGLKLITARSRLIRDLAPGNMLSVRLNQKELEQLLPDKISIAAVNAPQLCTVAGAPIDIQQFAEKLTTLDIPNRHLQTSHAFHSPYMLPAEESFKRVVETVHLSSPTIPIASTVTGTWLTDSEATSATYWAQHMISTVQFSAAVLFIHQEINPVFLECGPGNVTSTLVQQHRISTFPPLSSLAMPLGNQSPTSIQHIVGKLWQLGVKIDWNAFFSKQYRTLLRNLPSYAFQKKRHWLMPKETETIPYLPMRKSNIIQEITQLLEDTTGIDLSKANVEDSFIDLGLDSLLLTQIASHIKQRFGVSVTFRQLSEDLSNLQLLATYLDQQLPAEKAPVEDKTRIDITSPAPIFAPQPLVAPASVSTPNPTALNLIAQQLNLLSQQIQLLQGISLSPVPVASISEPVPTSTPSENSQKTEELTQEDKENLRKPFGAIARIEKHATELGHSQQRFLTDFIERYTTQTINSKNFTQEHRRYMADPRVVSGFKPALKELIYSIVTNKSQGSRLWDIDGNEYVDALNGFGSNFLGYNAPVVKKALSEQLEKGYEIGPQHELSGEVCKLICEFTGHDRAALCNTGSEAVLGAVRIARTVTSKKTIVAFSGSYHGINDEVLVRGTKKLKSFPAVAGVMPEAVENILILDYGTEESLKIIAERADELAAVLVEPVQSRRPEFQPVAYLKKLRALTAEKSIILIFDEVITGFRMHPGGAQALFDIKADLATYGKVIGGGLSIGVIAGKTNYMDALDGGYWQYGDTSTPEVGVTYFAGTFVRHPLALATTHAVLSYLNEQGPSLQEKVNGKTAYLTHALNTICRQYELPLFAVHFGSLWKIKFHHDYPYYELLFAVMRLKKIHIWDHFPCFLTIAHTDEDIETIIQAFKESVQELIAAGFIPTAAQLNEQAFGQPPISGAILGKDASGNPAWLIEDLHQQGVYRIVDKHESTR